MNNKPKANGAALLPILVFVILYLGLGVLFEYVLKIDMGFYNIPIVLIFVIALFTAAFQTKADTFNDKVKIMADGLSDPNIFTMILIFIMAGAFVGIVGRDSAESVAYFILSIIPPQLAVSVLFIVSCLVSLAMGTSVGTITLITPIAVAVSFASGFTMPLCVGSVVCGSMFGDNLSLISDTTIAACNGQGVPMKAKFKANFMIALPAAIVALIAFTIFSLNTYTGGAVVQDYNIIQIIPYILVLICGIIGLNVFLVLAIGIVSGIIIMLATGSIVATDILANMGTGISGMFETCMVAILVAALCSLVRHNGGFEALLDWVHRTFKGKSGGQFSIGILVAAMDIATANNTVAIVMANPIASQISDEYGIKREKTASLLDTCSCIVQGVIPYGAQMLVAISAVATTSAALGQEVTISAFEIVPYMFYTFTLLISVIISIIFTKKKKEK